MNTSNTTKVVEDSIELAVNIAGNKKKGLIMLQDFDVPLELKNDLLPSKNNLLPTYLSSTDLVHGAEGIKLLIEALSKCVDFINGIIKNLESYYSESTEEWRISTYQSELTECYELAQYMEREIKYQFSKCVNLLKYLN